MPARTILVIGTLDTKGAEIAYVRALIEARGHIPLILDAGVTEPPWQADVDASRVAAAGGGDVEILRAAGDRATALDVMCRGARAVALELLAAGRIDGVLGLGGSGGTAIATAAMTALPVGLPKVMVSTMASGDVSSYVDVKDVTMMYSVVDIAGLNRLSRRILANAAGAVCGMVEQALPPVEDRPLVAATMFGVTTPCVTRIRESLEASGYEVLVFHATGSGGRAMEALIEDGFVVGVADITTTEWCDEVIGGVLSAGPERLEAAGRAGIPQVVSVGALDMCNWGPIDTVPEPFRERNLYRHNPSVTLMRTTPQENAEVGRKIATKLNEATGPTALFLPLRGVSMIDAEGGPFWSPEADAALFEAIRATVDRSRVELVELDLHVNDPAFADAMAARLLEMLASR
ncbi:MAG TPA: Tm-1-like ATP-binding domain-containing protein [Candidatus Limnocylindrales bacterium]|nr:Tm-1-like ATP-binding domain-containing protein [Candidatus Limnocylindrales bacterium]